MAKRWLGLIGLMVVLAGPIGAQEVWLDGELELQMLAPSSMDPGGPEKDFRMGLGPDSVVNMEASLREDFSVFWTFNVAAEVDSRTAPLVTAPVSPSPREQYYARLTGLGGPGKVLKAGKFHVPFGLRTLDRKDKLIDLFDTGVRLEWPCQKGTLSATLVDGHLESGEDYSRFYVGAEGRKGPLSGAVDVGWGNGRGLFGVGGEYHPEGNWTLRGEFLAGDVEAAGITGNIGHDISVNALYLEAAYQFPETPYTGVFKFRGAEFGNADNTETKWGVHYNLNEAATVELEWWNNSLNPNLEDGLIQELDLQY